MNNFDTERSNYSYFSRITTRWMDNDIYGHINNVTYYSYFDTVANEFLITRGGMDIQNADIVGFVVASNCQYKSPITYPDQLDAGFRVNRLGKSSVEYGIAIFKKNEDNASAHGTFTHVFVDRLKNSAVPIPDTIRAALQSALIEPADVSSL